MSRPMFLLSPTLARVPVTHAFSTRVGGVSEGPLASLNLGRAVGDEPARVDENLRRLKEVVHFDGIVVTARQVHGDTVGVLTREEVTAEDGLWSQLPPEEGGSAQIGIADALITDLPGVAVGVCTADCVPILVSSRKGEVVAAVHAGWRGVSLNLLGRTVDVIRQVWGIEGGELVVAIGPAIGPSSFEVGPEVVEALRPWLSPQELTPGVGDRSMIDLCGVVRAQARAAGVPEGSIDLLSRDTFADPELFFSHRRDKGETGRHLSLIARGRPSSPRSAARGWLGVALAWGVALALVVGARLLARELAPTPFNTAAPEVIAARVRDAQVELRRGSPSQALERLVQLRREDPLNPYIHALLAQAHARTPGGEVDALASGAMALTLDPGFGEVWYNQACWLTRVGRVEEALLALQEAAALGVDDRAAAAADPDLKALAGDRRMGLYLAGGPLAPLGATARLTLSPEVLEVGQQGILHLQIWDLSDEAPPPRVEFLGVRLSNAVEVEPPRWESLPLPTGGTEWSVRWSVTGRTSYRGELGPWQVRLGELPVPVEALELTVRGEARAPRGEAIELAPLLSTRAEPPVQP